MTFIHPSVRIRRYTTPHSVGRLEALSAAPIRLTCPCFPGGGWQHQPPSQDGGWGLPAAPETNGEGPNPLGKMAALVMMTWWLDDDDVVFSFLGVVSNCFQVWGVSFWEGRYIVLWGRYIFKKYLEKKHWIGTLGKRVFIFSVNKGLSNGAKKNLYSPSNMSGINRWWFCKTFTYVQY